MCGVFLIIIIFCRIELFVFVILKVGGNILSINYVDILILVLWDVSLNKHTLKQHKLHWKSQKGSKLSRFIFKYFQIRQQHHRTRYARCQEYWEWWGNFRNVNSVWHTIFYTDHLYLLDCNQKKILQDEGKM